MLRAKNIIATGCHTSAVQRRARRAAASAAHRRAGRSRAIDGAFTTTCCALDHRRLSISLAFPLRCRDGPTWFDINADINAQLNVASHGLKNREDRDSRNRSETRG